MKSLKVIKYNLSAVKTVMSIFYAIYILSCICLTVVNCYLDQKMSLVGIDLINLTFIVITGTCIFRDGFYISQSNNISRKTYLKGTILSIFPIALITTLVSMIINRVVNTFVEAPSIYDMIFTNLENVNGATRWIQSNDISTLTNTLLFEFSLFSVIFAVGLAVSMLYYRCNKVLKAVVLVSPLIFIMAVNIIATYTEKLNVVIVKIVNWNMQSPYLSIVTLIIIFSVLSGIMYQLVKKVVIKDR